LPTEDIDREPRIAGGTVDIGADEYAAGSADTTPPLITLLGANPLNLEIGTPYVEPGATATDDVDGDISASIIIDSSAVDTNTLGSYSVTYNVSDSSGNPATEVIRTVNVVDTTAPTFELSIPSDGATNVAVDTNIEVHVRDSGAGVNQATIVMTVEGAAVTPIISGDASDFTLSYDPASDFGNAQEVNVSVTAQDTESNPGSADFSFLTLSGSVWDPVGDEDNDGIPNGVEETLLFTDPTLKTLFVRPKQEIGFLSYVYWNEFIALFPWPGRPGFANIAPFVNAGIEVSVIGDSNNPYVPMRDFAYDPATDANQPPCDILEIVYKQDTSYCSYNEANEGHTFFTGTTWSWDTKGYTPNNPTSSHYLKYNYHTPIIYPFPLENYFSEGVYDSIQVSQLPITGVAGCGYDQCWDFDNSSTLNVNQADSVNGLPDDTVEFNVITFDGDGEIQSVGAMGLGYDRDAVKRRTIIHEMGHGLLNALSGDHCTDNQCIMYNSVADWELYEFGSPIGCTHSPGGSKDIRAAGVIHNTVHMP
jgi:hypothetical protein